MAIEYVVHRDDDGEIESCDCCGCDVATHLFEKPMHMVSEAGRKRLVCDPTAREDQFAYCEVCSTTLISSVNDYPNQHYEDGHILRCMAQCVNLIIQKISESKLSQ